MNLSLPNFDIPYLQQLSACGWLSKESEATASRIKQLSDAASRRQAIIGDGDTARYLRLIIGLVSDEKLLPHLHLDIATKHWFKKNPPKATVNSAEVFEVITQFANEEIMVGASGDFEIPWTNLPKDGLIRSTQFKMQFGNAAVEQTAATFSIRRTPACEVAWRVSGEDGQNASIHILLALQEKIDSEYLLRIYSQIETVWRKLILSESQGE
jgi:hypothetical protein